MGVEAMIVRRSLVVLVCAVGLAGASAAPALAGEVKGPPGTINNTNETGALTHANSACAASGLNDLDSSAGQTASKVQTAADSWKYYGLAKGSVGTLCRGGSGQREKARGSPSAGVRDGGSCKTTLRAPSGEETRRSERVRRQGLEPRTRG